MIDVILLNFLVFLFGLCIGSFLNCAIYRLEQNQSFLGGRSYCPECKHNLVWLDLIPVLSFLFLKGRCQYCCKKISIQYPLVEISVAIVFLLITNYQLPIFNAIDLINLAFLFYIASSLIVIFVYDLKFYLIPDKVLFPAIFITFLYRIVNSILIGNWELGIGNYFLAVVIASGFFLFIYLISRGQWMGFGDVKLAILLGLTLGCPNILVGLFLAFFLGAIIGLILIFFDKKGLKSEVPFAPFLIIGTLIAMLFGNQIINWYSSFLIF